MQNFTSTDFARSIADDMIAKRFGSEYGIYTVDTYLDFIDRRATAHLDAHLARRVRQTAGAQRRRARLSLENASTVIMALPMNDVHSGKTVWAEIDFQTWITLIEMGADCAWFYAHKGKDRRAGQVRTNAPMASATTNKNSTVARLIVNAKAGQQARTLDRNPLNLRTGNAYLLGSPTRGEVRNGRAKTDSAAFLRQQQALRHAAVGSQYGISDKADK